MKAALILVDIQKDYFPGGRMELVRINDASRNAKELLRFFREKNRPIFHIQHIAVRDNATFFLPNSPGIDIHENVTPLPDEQVIQKHHPNSFLNTKLHEELLKAGIDSVVICGAMSHMCIDATTRAAADLGFQCIVVHDACATKDLIFGDKAVPAEMVHSAFMAALQPVYAKVMDLSSFTSWMIQNFSNQPG
ncbi:MAG TPA: cysteine hydrolase family protein [Desulfobacterales bacterium]|nr:cysteine hydrolase family protein [Desulfobacterales bacterium]